MSAEQPSPPDLAAAAPAVAPRRRPRGADARLALGVAGSLVLVGAACRELLRFQPTTQMSVSISGEVEEFFFEPSDSSPVVVLLLCGWLLWRRRARLAALWGRTGPLAGTAAAWAAALALFAWSVRAGAPDLQAIALIPALLGAGNLLGGPAAMRVMAPPAAVLLFAVPLPAPLLNQIVWWLQIATADFTGFLLGAIGASALVSGDRIIMSDGLFAIIETCSGLRSIETLGMLAILMVDLFGRRGAHALALLLLSPFVAFLVNGFRCLGLIYNPHADVASIHNLQGIAMLLGGVMVLYFADGLLARWLPEPRGHSPIERRARRDPRPRRPLARPVAVLCGFAGLLFALSWLPPFATEPVDGRSVAASVPARVGAWDGSLQKTDWLFLGKAAFGQIAHRRYRSGRDSVDVFVGQAEPGQRLRSYLSPKIAFPGSGWIVESEQPVRIADRDATLRVLRKGSSRTLVAHWFEASGGVARESARALLALDTAPLPRTRIPLAVRLSTPLPSTAEGSLRQARGRLEGLARELVPALETMVTPRGA